MWLVFLLLCLAAPSAFAQVPAEMGWLGVSIGEVGEDLAERLGAAFGPASGIGVQVVQVLENSPAEAARLELGDVIVRVDSQPIWDVRQLQQIIRGVPVNHRVVLVVLRGTSRLQIPVTIGPMPPAARAQVAGERFGFVIREADEPDESSGGTTAARLTVAFVVPNSPASRAGLQPSDMVVRVNDQPVLDIEAFAAALWRATDTATLVVERRGATAPITLTLDRRS